MSASVDTSLHREFHSIDSEESGKVKIPLHGRGSLTVCRNQERFFFAISIINDYSLLEGHPKSSQLMYRVSWNGMNSDDIPIDGVKRIDATAGMDEQHRLIITICATAPGKVTAPGKTKYRASFICDQNTENKLKILTGSTSGFCILS